jgi:radical SAM superfamily enzyme YgiQ (UPF0313 family)
MAIRRLLLVNPWIADFTAFDLWSKPLGLLYIAKFLRQFGYEIELLDFMDRGRWGGQQTGRFNDGRGKYFKTILPKPVAAQALPRRFGLYGAKPEQIHHYLAQASKPDAILLTSLINYWYPGVSATTKLLRQYFPTTPIILGGIYPSLLPNHAQSTIQPDYLITGYGEKQVLQLLDALFGIERDYSRIPPYDDTGYLPWDLYPILKAAVILTSRGCPYHCTYCAAHRLHPNFHQRQAQEVLEEIVHIYQHWKLQHFVFYDDALLANRAHHIVPILQGVLARKLTVNFHTPNGLFARAIDQQLADLMFASGFKTVRLSLESVDPAIQAASSHKVSNQAFIDAMTHLERAGFSRQAIEVYLIMGLPGQTYSQVQQAIDFVHAQGAIVRLASFSPIPGTPAWEELVAQGLLNADDDPLLTNATLFPLHGRDLSYADYLELRHYANLNNARLVQKHPVANELE